MYDAYFQKTQKSQTRENVIPTADRLLNTHAFLTIFSQQIFLVQNTHAFLTIFLKKNILVQITHAFLTIFLQQNILVQITHAFLTIFLKQIFLVQITHAFLTIFINQNILVQITHAFLTIFYTFFRKIQKKPVSWAKSHKLNMWFQNHSKWSKLLKKIAKRNSFYTRLLYCNN